MYKRTVIYTESISVNVGITLADTLRVTEQRVSAQHCTITYLQPQIAYTHQCH